MEDSEYEENLSMETVTLEDVPNVEGEVELKVELIISLEELRKSIMKNKYMKEKFSKCQRVQKSKEDEVKTLQKELYNLGKQAMDSM